MHEVLLTRFEGLGGLLSHYIERNVWLWNVSVFYGKCYIVVANVWECVIKMQHVIK